MKTTHAVWELHNIGLVTYEITLCEGDNLEALAKEEKRVTEAGAQYLVVKTPVHCPSLLFGLPGLGYTFVETVFRVAVKRNEYSASPLTSRLDRGLSVIERMEGEELQRVYHQVRRGMFITDRISLDPMFSVAKSANRYANWLESMVNQGGKVYELLRDGMDENPLGFFVITRVDASTVDPVLMGLYDEAADRGMGALLHKKTLDTCFEWPCQRLQSTVVSNNFKALRLYISVGAIITDMQYTYIKHLH